MSAGGAFGGARGYQPKPPDKGVFPLDHFGECKQAKEEYMACLREQGHQAESCRSLAKAYLECRMERNLMAQQDLKQLGFRNDHGATMEGGSKQEEQSEVSEGRGSQQGTDANERKRQGFIAGIRR